MALVSQNVVQDGDIFFSFQKKEQLNDKFENARYVKLGIYCARNVCVRKLVPRQFHVDVLNINCGGACWVKESYQVIANIHREMKTLGDILSGQVFYIYEHHCIIRIDSLYTFI